MVEWKNLFNEKNFTTDQMKLFNTIKKNILFIDRFIKKSIRLLDFKKKDIFIAKGSYVDPCVEIGRCTRINAQSHLGKCKIGSFCAIGGRLVVRSSDHYINYLNIQDWAQQKIIRSNVRVCGKTKGAVIIGNAVWIGDSVIILSGCNIGDGAVIGAGSVVTKDIPPYCVAVGNPARIIKKRFSEKVISRIKNIRWWEWDDHKIYEHKEIFDIDLHKSSLNEIDLVLKKYNL